jgi:hypothetical protein
MISSEDNDTLSPGRGGGGEEGGEEPATNEDIEESDIIGDGTVCIACERKRAGGKPYKHGHASFCEKSIYYGLSDEQINAVKEERSNKLKDTKENVLRRMGLSAKDTELKFPEISSTYPKVCDIPASLSSTHLSALVSANDTHPAKAPKAVTIILRYLQMLAPSLKKGTNQVIEHEDNLTKLEFFRSIFPRGSVTFTVPKEDPTVKPNPDYRIAEECKLLLVRWELQTEEDIKCPFCDDGTLTYKKVAFSRTAVKPIIDIEGKLTWAVGSTYRCGKCDQTAHATDPELLQSLPTWMQQAYAVDSVWINKVKTFQIGRRLGGLIETLFVGEGYDGHFVSYFLRKLYDNRYRTDHKLLVEAFEMHGETGPKKDEWTFDKWTGEFAFPLGDFLREAFDFSRKDEVKEVQKMPSYATQASRPPPGSPSMRSRAGPNQAHRAPSRSPGSEAGATGQITPSKRQARPEDYADHHVKQPRLVHPNQHMVHHTLEPPPPLPMFVTQGRAGMSPVAMAPHTPPGYSGHQWPGYGPGPPFPMHYSPPPPPRYHPGFGFGGLPPTPGRKAPSTATPQSVAPPQEDAKHNNRGDESKP